MKTSSSNRLATVSQRVAGGLTERMRRRRFAWAVAVGIVAATGWSLLLTWTSGLPLVSDVSLAASAERENTPAMWLVAFAVSSCAMLVVHAAVELLVRGTRLGAGRTR